MALFTDFFDHSKGNSVPLREFPLLFSMQLHTGFCGVLFVVIWFFAIATSFPEALANELWRYRKYELGAVAAAFFILAWLSLFALLQSTSILQNSRTGPIGNERDARRVRQWLTLLSLAYILVCAVLISLTGGVRSPFTLFYVMIYSLTVKRIHFPFPGLHVFVVFSVVLLAGCGLYGYFSEGAKNAVDAVLAHPYHVYVATTALALSLAVPTASALLVARKHAVLQADEDGGA